MGALAFLGMMVVGVYLIFMFEDPDSERRASEWRRDHPKPAAPMRDHFNPTNLILVGLVVAAIALAVVSVSR
jgi:hypothetical protein